MLNNGEGLPRLPFSLCLNKAIDDDSLVRNKFYFKAALSLPKAYLHVVHHVYFCRLHR